MGPRSRPWLWKSSTSPIMVTQSSFLPRNIESFDVFCAGVRTSRGILTIAGLFISIWREVYYSWSRKWTLPHRTGSSIIGGWVGGRRLGPHRRTAARRRLRAPQRYHGRARNITAIRETKTRENPKRTITTETSVRMARNPGNVKRS